MNTQTPAHTHTPAYDHIHGDAFVIRWPSPAPPYSFPPFCFQKPSRKTWPKAPQTRASFPLNLCQLQPDRSTTAATTTTWTTMCSWNARCPATSHSFLVICVQHFHRVINNNQISQLKKSHHSVLIPTNTITIEEPKGKLTNQVLSISANKTSKKY